MLCLFIKMLCIKQKLPIQLYLSDIISKHSYSPCILFNTNHSVINPPSTSQLLGSLGTCENFLRFFVDKVDTIRSYFIPPPYDPSVPLFSSVVFDHYETISLNSLAELVSRLKDSMCHLDTISSSFLKKSLTLLALMF